MQVDASADAERRDFWEIWEDREQTRSTSNFALPRRTLARTNRRSHFRRGYSRPPVHNAHRLRCGCSMAIRTGTRPPRSRTSQATAFCLGVC